MIINSNSTLRELEKEHSGSSNSAVAEARYALRDTVITDLLASQPIIEVSHVEDLDRVGRFTIASEHFKRCSDSCKKTLLHDEHHFVRSAANISDSHRGH